MSKVKYRIKVVKRFYTKYYPQVKPSWCPFWFTLDKCGSKNTAEVVIAIDKEYRKPSKTHYIEVE